MSFFLFFSIIFLNTLDRVVVAFFFQNPFPFYLGRPFIFFYFLFFYFFFFETVLFFSDFCRGKRLYLVFRHTKGCPLPRLEAADRIFEYNAIRTSFFLNNFALLYFIFHSGTSRNWGSNFFVPTISRLKRWNSNDG